MQFAARFPIRVGIVAWPGRPEVSTVVVKLTYDVTSRGVLALADPQEPLGLDVLGADGLVLHPTDFAPAKGACDVVFVGRALLRAVGPVRLAVDPVRKLVEHPAELGARPGFGASGDPTDPRVHASWGSASFDFEAFQCAPRDQRRPIGAPPIAIAYDYGSQHVVTQLEGRVPEALVIDRTGWTAPRLVPLRADTILIDAERDRVCVVFRGVVEVAEGCDPLLAVEPSSPLRAFTPKEMEGWPQAEAAEPALVRRLQSLAASVGGPETSGAGDDDAFDTTARLIATTVAATARPAEAATRAAPPTEISAQRPPGAPPPGPPTQPLVEAPRFGPPPPPRAHDATPPAAVAPTPRLGGLMMVPLERHRAHATLPPAAPGPGTEAPAAASATSSQGLPPPRASEPGAIPPGPPIAPPATAAPATTSPPTAAPPAAVPPAPAAPATSPPPSLRTPARTIQLPRREIVERPAGDVAPPQAGAALPFTRAASIPAARPSSPASLPFATPTNEPAPGSVSATQPGGDDDEGDALGSATVSLPMPPALREALDGEASGRAQVARPDPLPFGRSPTGGGAALERPHGPPNPTSDEEAPTDRPPPPRVTPHVQLPPAARIPQDTLLDHDEPDDVIGRHTVTTEVPAALRVLPFATQAAPLAPSPAPSRAGLPFGAPGRTPTSDDVGPPPEAPLGRFSTGDTEPPPRVSTGPAEVARPPVAEAGTTSKGVRVLSRDEFVAIRAALWVNPGARRELLRKRGLTELGWRLSERRFLKQLAQQPRPDQLVSVMLGLKDEVARTSAAPRATDEAP